MEQKKYYIDATLKILKKGKLRGKHKVKISGKTFLIYPGVFSPRDFLNTEFYTQNIKITKMEKFLEIGTGSGITSVIAALRGASFVVATDINSICLKNARENVEIHKVAAKVSLRKGDIFEPILAKEKFDTIYWNAPFAYVEKKHLTLSEKSVADNKYSSITRFVRESDKYLKKGGKILIGFSKTIGNFNLLQEILEESGFGYKIIAQETFMINGQEISFELVEGKKK